MFALFSLAVINLLGGYFRAWSSLHLQVQVGQLYKMLQNPIHTLYSQTCNRSDILWHKTLNDPSVFVLLQTFDQISKVYLCYNVITVFFSSKCVRHNQLELFKDNACNLSNCGTRSTLCNAKMLTALISIEHRECVYLSYVGGLISIRMFMNMRITCWWAIVNLTRRINLILTSSLLNYKAYIFPHTLVIIHKLVSYLPYYQRERYSLVLRKSVWVVFVVLCLFVRQYFSAKGCC
jgi:hypothetical protein